MAHEHLPPNFDPEHPYSSLVRSSDRAKVLSQLVISIWETALGLTLAPVEQPPEEVAGQKTRTAVVHLGGAWRGSVALTAAATLAEECAARMYATATPMLSPAEVQDSWGELGNMVAGNLKALVIGPTQLSLPTVMEGSTYVFRVPRASKLNELTYACLGHRLIVTVLKLDDEKSESPGWA